MSEMQATTPAPVESQKRSILLSAFLIMLVMLVAWRFIFPLTALAAITLASVGSVIVIAMIVMTTALLLFYLLKGVAMISFGLIILFGVILSIVICPFLFPILIPLTFIMLCIALFRR